MAKSRWQQDYAAIVKDLFPDSVLSSVGIPLGQVEGWKAMGLGSRQVLPPHCGSTSGQSPVCGLTFVFLFEKEKKHFHNPKLTLAEVSGAIFSLHIKGLVGDCQGLF